MKPDFSKIDISYPESKNKYSDLLMTEVPGLAPYTRGNYTSMYLQHPMEVWYEPETNDPKELNHSLKQLISSGAGNFQFGADPLSLKDWKIIFSKINLKNIKAGFNSLENFHSFNEYLKSENEDASKFTIRIFAETKDMSSLKAFKNVKVILKMNELTELISIASEIKDLDKNLAIRFKTTSYFESIAAMRSARRIWSETANDENAKLSLDVLIPGSENNLVKSTTIAVAAWMGGAQSITIPLSPNWENEAFVNIPRIIEEETHIQNTIDALGGAFHLEKLTEDYVNTTLK